jgi:hypothetical protein
MLKGTESLSTLTPLARPVSAGCAICGTHTGYDFVFPPLCSELCKVKIKSRSGWRPKCSIHISPCEPFDSEIRACRPVYQSKSCHMWWRDSQNQSASSLPH